MDDSDVAVMYITASINVYINLRCFITYHYLVLLLYEITLFEAVNPVCSVALCHFAVNAVVLGEEIGDGHLVELLALNGTP